MQKSQELEKILQDSALDISALRSANYEVASDEAEDIKVKEQLREFRMQKEQSATERDATFTKLVRQFVINYSDKYQQNKNLKFVFYIWVMVLFTLIMIFPFIVIVLAATSFIEDWEVVAGLITSVGAIITTVIVIPKTIAQYLFSLKEDETIIRIISELHSGDLQNIDPRNSSK